MTEQQAMLRAAVQGQLRGYDDPRVMFENGALKVGPVDGQENRWIVKGWSFHGKDQAEDRDGGRGVSLWAVYFALMYPVYIEENTARKSVKIKGPYATVVLDKKKKRIVTVYGKARVRELAAAPAKAPPPARSIGEG